MNPTRFSLLQDGSSPRWRGTLGPDARGCGRFRIIPALAGNTAPLSGRGPPPADHPRAGGEHRATRSCMASPIGSSPRWRGTPPHPESPEFEPRIIPALAGNTAGLHPLHDVDADHPRAGGEHATKTSPMLPSSGSSPRWRGTPDCAFQGVYDRRIIPALAGNTSPGRAP